MMYELVKNSLRAVQERFVDSDRVAPPIRIIVADGIEDVTIKVVVLCFLSFPLSISIFCCTGLIQLLLWVNLIGLR